MYVRARVRACRRAGARERASARQQGLGRADVAHACPPTALLVYLHPELSTAHARAKGVAIRLAYNAR